MNDARRQLIIDRANNLIKDASTPENRVAIAIVVSDLMHAAGIYKGFNYVDWVDGGWQRWCDDGKPADNTPYLGDQTKIRYY